MTEKIYLSAEDYHIASFKLAHMIIKSGWEPDDMIALWRGGAPVGVIVHEFLHYHGLQPRHRTLKCHSYTGIKSRHNEVIFENADDIFKSIIPGSKMLIIDDIFDTGNTAKAVIEKMKSFNLDIRFATVFWKPDQNQTDLQPDFFVVKTGQWVVFPHELDGLTTDEIKEKSPKIFDLLDLERLVKEQ
ncbi:MAG: phosphoribosyltransferase family protein [Kiritimatiellae bacterium]|jgi:hypoxanthine phosphoribosyltransferase|nr:phosphoribosyltransferase family protein [Kiritimatiellia bacterium]